MLHSSVTLRCCCLLFPPRSGAELIGHHAVHGSRGAAGLPVLVLQRRYVGVWMHTGCVDVSHRAIVSRPRDCQPAAYHRQGQHVHCLSSLFPVLTCYMLYIPGAGHKNSHRLRTQVRPVLQRQQHHLAHCPGVLGDAVQRDQRQQRVCATRGYRSVGSIASVGV